MSGKGAAFRIDVIVNSLNELRQEKGALEQRYIDEKSRNKSLEFKLEQDSMKFNQSKERNCKMHETVKLAEQKVAQTDSQTDRLTEINDAKQKIIADLNDKIKQEMDKQEDTVAHFQLKLLELTQLFRNAKQVYTKTTLDKEINAWKENMETFVAEAYLQEVGRAGRDGYPVSAVAYFNKQDSCRTYYEGFHSQQRMPLLITGLKMNTIAAIPVREFISEICGIHRLTTQLIFLAEEKQIELTDVTKALENLSLDTDRFKELVDKKMGHEGLTYKDLRTTIDLLTRKQERIERFLDWLVSCLSKANSWLQETRMENPMNGEVHLELEKGQMDFAQEIYEEENTHYATQDCYSDYGTRQMELPQEVSGKGNTHYATQDRYSGFGIRQIEVAQEIRNEENSYYAVQDHHSGSQTAHRAEPVNQDASNIPTDNYRQTPMLQQSPFFISLPFSRSR